MADTDSNRQLKLKCDNCKNKFRELFELACSHKLCSICKNKTKTGRNYTCLIKGCAKFTDRVPVQVLIEDSLVPESENEAIKKAKELSVKYKNILHQRQRDCIEHVDKLERSISEIKNDEKRTLHELSKKFDIRMNQLKAHYGDMRTQFKTSISQRVTNLNAIVKDLKKSLNEIGSEITKLSANIEAIFEKGDLKKASDFNSELEIKTETTEVIELDLGEFKTDINQTEDFHLGDSLAISAPDPTIKRKSIKAENVPQNDLTALRDRRLTLEKKTAIPNNVHSLSLLDGDQLCLSEGFQGFSLYDKNLEKQKSFKAGKMRCVYDVCQLVDKNFAVAATTGLFQVNEDGDVTDTFAEGSYTSVATYRGRIFAGFSDAKAKPPCQIHTFQGNSRAKKQLLTSLTCDSDHHIKVALGRDLIYVSCKQDNVITIMSMENGTHLQVITKAMDQFNLDGPFVNQVDDNSSALVCERNDRVHVLLQNGQGYEVGTDQPIKKPVGVLFVDGVLFAISSSYKVLYSFK